MGLHKVSRGLKKVDAHMPWGALSVARQLPPLETVFRGRGIGFHVGGCHFRKYMHINTKNKQIHHIRIIHTYTQKTSKYIIYVSYIRIHAYIYIYIR